MGASNGPPPGGPLQSPFWSTFSDDPKVFARLQACRRSHAYNIKHYRKGGDTGGHCTAIMAAIDRLGITAPGEDTDDVLNRRVGDYTEALIYAFKTQYFIWDESRQTGPDKVCGVWTIGWLDQALMATAEQKAAEEAAVKTSPGKKSLVRASPMVARSMMMRAP